MSEGQASGPRRYGISRGKQAGSWRYWDVAWYAAARGLESCTRQRMRSMNERIWRTF
jgi:hypothetical protein